MKSTSSPIIHSMLSEGLAARVLRDGWLKLTVNEAGDDIPSALENIAGMLGHTIAGRAGEKLETLIPTQRGSANAKSLSVFHGRGSFPIHTDGAHYLQPPRFVVLACASPGMSPVPTTLIRFGDLMISASQRLQLEAAPFLVRNGRRSFYSTICNPSRMFIRYDAGCMVPQNAMSEASAGFIAHRAREVGHTLFHWRTGDVLLIDNWNVLHGRGLGSAIASTDRHLFRVSVQ